MMVEVRGTVENRPPEVPQGGWERTSLLLEHRRSSHSLWLLQCLQLCFHPGNETPLYMTQWLMSSEAGHPTADMVHKVVHALSWATNCFLFLTVYVYLHVHYSAVQYSIHPQPVTG